MTPADLARLMAERPRPGRAADSHGDAFPGPLSVRVADRLDDDQLAALARLCILLGQHTDEDHDNEGTDTLMPGDIIPPIEGMRCGGLPADDGYTPPFNAEQYDDATRDGFAELHAMGGLYEDKTPRVVGLDKAGMVYAGAGVLTKVVPCRCGEHLPGGTIKGSPAAADCAARAKAKATGDADG